MNELDIRIETTAPAEARTPLLVLPSFENEARPEGAAAELDERIGGLLARTAERGDFRGAEGESLLLYPPMGREVGAERVLRIGLGRRSDFSAERLRIATGHAVRAAERIRADALAMAFDAATTGEHALYAFDAALAVSEAAVLAAWRYDELKRRSQDGGGDPRGRVESVVVLAPDDETAGTYERAAAHGRAVGRGENLARLLASRPGNVATPSHLAEIAGQLADEHGLALTVLDREGMERENLHALLAVARGSEEEPRFIVLDYRGGADGDPPLALIGKGVTFDAGGISIKPSQKMEEMKYDMSGAAAVLGAMQAIAELGLPANVVGVVPATENLPSGRALKPGDVIRSRAGTSIEIINTDAEGRLILADALAYTRDTYSPRAMLDAATLTGACIVALGHHAVALMGTDDALVDDVRAAGERTGERCWPLPLWKDYRSQLDSDVADIKNSGGRPAGSITAGWFLREFAGDASWAHLDVAGTAWRDDAPAYLSRGATGVPTRLFVEWVRSRTAE